MNNNKKLGLAIGLTAIAAFSAGFVTAADHGDGRLSKGLVKALNSVGENLFGAINFGASIVGGVPPDDNSPAPDVVQIDLAGGQPPDDSLPVFLNVFAPPPDDNLDACVATAQIAVTADGVRVIINPDVTSPAGNPIVAEYGAPLGAPPAPCREAGSNPPDDGIGDGPG